MNLILPKDYDPRLTIRQTQEAIKYNPTNYQTDQSQD